MKLLKNVLIIILLLHSIAAIGQDKVEQEVRIKTSQVPSEAKRWLKDAFESVRKPKWYKEYSEQGYSFEAKFKFQNRFHSAEFDSLGKVQDVEIELDWKDLSEEIKLNLNTYFNEMLSGFKLGKIQIQYSGEPGDLEDFFDEEEMNGVLIQYEIEYQADDETGVNRLWEGTFSSDGRFIAHRRIEIREIFNLYF